MPLEEKVMTELKAAMLAKDEKSLRSLRAIKAAILNAKTAEGAGGMISESDEIKLLQKLVKQRKDSFEIFEQQKRDDLAKKEKEEIEIIEKFLPEQLDVEKLKEIIEGIIKQTGLSAPADMGKVMGLANKQLSGKADGKTIAGIVKDLLAAK
ncbi:MAG: GatB/YqeY domain-containing protein [Ginsengibacter sp.]